MRIIVGVADMKLSSVVEGVIVTHGLGSCLAVTIYDPLLVLGGMVHVMMPSAASNPERAKSNPFMFVDAGMDAFVQQMLELGSDRRRWQLTVVGGALMTGSHYFEIGKKNYVTLKKTLWKHGLLTRAEDIGGQVARTLYLEVKSGRVWMTRGGEERTLFPKEAEARVPVGGISLCR